MNIKGPVSVEALAYGLLDAWEGGDHPDVPPGGKDFLRGQVELAARALSATREVLNYDGLGELCEAMYVTANAFACDVADGASIGDAVPLLAGCWDALFKPLPEPEESVTVSQVVSFMNELLAIDRSLVHALVETRHPCNKAIEDHPTVQASYDGSGHAPPVNCFSVGLLGILNGLFKTHPKSNLGKIQATYETNMRLVAFSLTDPPVCPK